MLMAARDSQLGGDLVSIVIPIYNGAEFIEGTLSTLRSQTHRNLDIVVVDDGSTDQGPEIVRRISEHDPRVRLILKPHQGIAHTRNVGLAWTQESSRYLLVHDQDDIITDDLIEGLYTRLSTSEQAVGSFALADYVDSTGNPLGDGVFATMMRTGRRPHRGRMQATQPAEAVQRPDLFISNRIYPPTTALLRKDVVIEIGGYDPSYEVADDWDLMLRLLRHGDLVMWDEIKVGYRRHGENASSNTPRNVRETRAVWANTYYSSLNSATDSRLLRSWWRAQQRTASRSKVQEGRRLIRAGQAHQGSLKIVDGLAHRLLMRPLRSWRSRIKEPSFHLARYQTGVCVQPRI